MAEALLELTGIAFAYPGTAKKVLSGLDLAFRPGDRIGLFGPNGSGKTTLLHIMGVPARYLHSDIETLERIAIIRALRQGEFSVLVGINLLREGLDIPEVSLVAILDADKEGFLRSVRSLIQTFGRASRNVAGHVILYADTMRRRSIAYFVSKSGLDIEGLGTKWVEILIAKGMLNDFIHPEGKLFFPKGSDVIEPIGRLKTAFRVSGVPVVYDNDAHPKDSKEFAAWPPHCIMRCARCKVTGAH